MNNAKPAIVGEPVKTENLQLHTCKFSLIIPGVNLCPSIMKDQNGNLVIIATQGFPVQIRVCDCGKLELYSARALALI